MSLLDFGLLAAKEELVKENILDMLSTADLNDVDTSSMAVKVAVTKVWHLARQGMEVNTGTEDCLLMLCGNFYAGPKMLIVCSLLVNSWETRNSNLGV